MKVSFNKGIFIVIGLIGLSVQTLKKQDWTMVAHACHSIFFKKFFQFVTHACHSIFLKKVFSLWPMLAIQFKKKIFRLWPMLAIQFFKKIFRFSFFPEKKNLEFFFPISTIFVLEY